MTLENLFQIGKLKSHKPTPEEISKLLVASQRNLKDAQIKAISAELRFDAAYKAVMQCALTALMANGYRPSTNEPGHHATVIQSLPKTISLSNDRMITLDKLRRMRNLCDYSSDGISEEETAACIRAAKNLLNDLERWLRAYRPDLIA